MTTYNKQNPYPVYIGQTVYGMFEPDTTADDISAMAAKLNRKTLKQVGQFKNILVNRDFELVRNGGELVPAVCAVTGSPDLCEVCTLQRIQDVRQEQYAGDLVCYDSEQYRNTLEAEANGALHCRKLPNWNPDTIAAAVMMFDIMAECLGYSSLVVGVINKQLRFVKLADLLEGMKA